MGDQVGLKRGEARKWFEQWHPHGVVYAPGTNSPSAVGCQQFNKWLSGKLLSQSVSVDSFGRLMRGTGFRSKTMRVSMGVCRVWLDCYFLRGAYD